MSRLSLRGQLTAVCALLLVAGLALAGVTALSLLRQSLVGQVDSQLTRAAPRLVQEATDGLPGPPLADETVPSDYYVVFSDREGRPVTHWATTSRELGVPDLPRWTVTELAAADGDARTVGSVGAGGRWRVLTRTLVAADGAPLGSVAVALPLTAADATLDAMRLALLGVGALVVGLGALAGWWAVRRALRPLTQIEDTAAAIAAGDLSRRVPDAGPQTEVGRLARALNGMLAQIEGAFAERTASQERMRRFVADASHELRTPLATIRGYGELYRMGALTSAEEVDRTVRRIEDSATRMGSLVDDLLSLARLDEGRPLRRQPVDLAVLAGDAAADLRALDPRRPVRVQPLAPAGTVAGAVTVGDEDRLRQVVANLVGNVVRHTPPGTAVEIAVGEAEGRAVLEVRDHGPGIPAEHADRVFERFYRVDAARGRESGGAGLGMAIVAAIVTAHGGQVSVRPTPGGGATVRVALPAAPPGPAAEDDTSPSDTASAPHRRDYDDQSLSPTR